jgi:hypothetical protein
MKINNLSNELKALVSSGKLRFINDHIKHRYSWGAGDIAGITQILLTSNDERDGVSDFQGNKLPANKILVADGIRFAYGENANAVSPGIIRYSNFSEDFPAELEGADLVLKQDGKVLARFAIADLLIPSFTTTVLGGGSETSTVVNKRVTKEERYYALPEPILIEGGKPLDIQLQLPVGIAAGGSGTNHAYVETAFSGMVTSPEA